MSVSPTSPSPLSDPSIGLALGGGGARGLAHIHVLQAFDDLSLKPARIAGSSIGALIGAAFAAGLTAREIRAHVFEALANRRLVVGTLWRTRPPSFAEFIAEGGLRFGQLNAERVIAAFLPARVPGQFEDLAIPLTVIATDFFAGRECELTSGPLPSAIAASAAIPAVFRPVRRDGVVLVDGGITNPLPFDVAARGCDLVVACDVTGGPVASGAPLPRPIETMFGASQLMMQAIIRAKLACGAPEIFVQPAVSGYGVLDFLRARVIVEETSPVREQTKRAIEAAFAGRGWPLGRPSPEEVARTVA
ncbi:patatin-like phospholipase family protein [Aureimonas pseudogalii]|uniref:NTE family protein n=1 Tax=Aureimonas pseudogalii TaxID=1744844 RepID=A0A7W6H394_9HYPH|nr:patatin-like phospholipase family protein [Aureimonas pseudogalii]MBB3996633.1 NTE family protein [Aureimonas pseudogalii]